MRASTRRRAEMQGASVIRITMNESCGLLKWFGLPESRRPLMFSRASDPSPEREHPPQTGHEPTWPLLPPWGLSKSLALSPAKGGQDLVLRFAVAAGTALDHEVAAVWTLDQSERLDRHVASLRPAYLGQHECSGGVSILSCS